MSYFVQKMKATTALVCIGALIAAQPAFANDINPSDLLNLSLEQLSNIEVTSVSKHAEKANEAAAAIFVITQEDIKRSGATNIPDALRMVPGISVAQSGAHDWAITARGSNGQFANKLLVLIDGRTVYSPLFSGVVWELQDTLMEDIEHIEVIRGPGATVWGANAVNGVINIITKNSKDTQGGLMTAGAGTSETAMTSLRYGMKIGDDSHVRVYAKYNDRDEQNNVGGTGSGDAWQKRQAGFRSDAKLTDKDSLTLQGDVYDTNEGVNLKLPTLSSPYLTSLADTIQASGANVLGRWTRNVSATSSIASQFYVDNTQYKNAAIAYNATTVDLDLQHTWTGMERNEVVWGAGYRHISDHEGITEQFSLAPAERVNTLLSAFVQDKITLNPNDLFLTLGSKFEHNDYTGVEIQPSARLSWLMTDTQMMWGSVSRAVHTPSRFTSDGQFSLGVIPPGGLPTLVAAAPNPYLKSEELIAYELGYRVQPSKKMSVDISTFYNDYSRLFTGAYGTPSVPGPYFFLPVPAGNTTTGHSMGYEISSKVDLQKNWQLALGYSYIDLIFDQKNSVGSTLSANPKNQFSIRSTYLFPYDVEMTNSLYYVDDLATANIPGYYRFDTRLSYPLTDKIELSLVGQNLLQDHHKEFSAFTYQSATEIGRSVYGNVSVKF